MRELSPIIIGEGFCAGQEHSFRSEAIIRFRYRDILGLKRTASSSRVCRGSNGGNRIHRRGGSSAALNFRCLLTHLGRELLLRLTKVFRRDIRYIRGDRRKCRNRFKHCGNGWCARFWSCGELGMVRGDTGQVYKRTGSTGILPWLRKLCVS